MIADMAARNLNPHTQQKARSAAGRRMLLFTTPARAIQPEKPIPDAKSRHRTRLAATQDRARASRNRVRAALKSP
jgi:hypothetical protein